MVGNGKQFDSDKFKEFRQSLGTQIAFTSVYHLESNVAVERANRVVFSTISKTLFNIRKGKWIEELLLTVDNDHINSQYNLQRCSIQPQPIVVGFDSNKFHEFWCSHLSCRISNFS
jgi:hypothetical protein